MRYFPILGELFSSDSILFLFIGLVAAVLIGFKLKNVKTWRDCLLASLLAYACCEALSNMHTNYMLELILLIVGSAAIGCFLGFLIRPILLPIKR